MTTKPLEFNPVRAGMHIATFGYHHVSKDTDRVALEEFAKNNGLEIQDGGEFTFTLVSSGTKKSLGTDWEALRKANQEKRLKAASAKKRRQA